MRLILLALVASLATIPAARAADDPVLAEATDLTGAVMFLDSGHPAWCWWSCAATAR